MVMRSAGCIVNDFIDKDIDMKVSRTQNRALASSQISLKNSLTYLKYPLPLKFLRLSERFIN